MSRRSMSRALQPKVSLLTRAGTRHPSLLLQRPRRLVAMTPALRAAAVAMMTMMTMMAMLPACTLVAAQGQPHVCSAPACEPDDATTCDEVYQSTISSIESTQVSLEEPAQQLLGLSEGETNPAPFLSQAAEVSQQADSLQSATSSTLQDLDVDELGGTAQATLSLEGSISNAAASLEAAAADLSAAIDSTGDRLTSLGSLYSSTSTDVDISRAGLCPADVPPVDNFHFSGVIDAQAGGYGSFQMETGAVENDLLVTFQTQEHSTPGVILATSSSVSPGVSSPDGFVLAATEAEVIFRLTCSEETTEVAMPFVSNASVLHTIHVVRSEENILLRVDGAATSQAVAPCRLRTTGIVHVGTPQPVVLRGQQLRSVHACIRTISVDGVLIVKHGLASTSFLAPAECRRTVSDILVLVDTSTSLFDTGPTHLEGFLAHVVSPLLSSQALTARVAVAQFAGPDTFHVVSPFTSDNATLFANFAANFEEQAGLSYLGTALREAAGVFQMDSRGSGNRLLLFATDGRTTSDDLSNVPVGLEALQQLGVNTVSIGIGTNIVVSALVQFAGGKAENVEIVGDTTNLPSLDRDLVADICAPSVPRLALFEQVGISNCTQLGCDDYVAHSSLLPDAQTYVVADNERVKGGLLDAARAADARIAGIDSTISSVLLRSQSAAVRMGAYSDFISSVEYTGAVNAVSTVVDQHATETQTLSSLVSALGAAAQQEALAATAADSIMSSTLTTLRSSLTELTSIDIEASQLLERTASTRQEAAAARTAAASQLSQASSLKSSVDALDGELSSMHTSLSTHVSQQRTTLSSAISAARMHELPVDVPTFSQLASQLAACLAQKVDLRQEFSTQAMELADEHDRQLARVSSLENAGGANVALFAQLSTDLQATEGRLSGEMDVVVSLETEADVERSMAEDGLSAQASRLASREAAATGRALDAAEVTSQLDIDVGAAKTTADQAGDTTSAGVACYDEASMLISTMQATRSTLRGTLTDVHSQASEASAELAGELSSRLSALASSQGAQAGHAGMQLSQASSLEAREAVVRESTAELSTTIGTIAPECLGSE